MDASCRNNSSNSLFTIGLTAEFIKSLIRVAHLNSGSILYTAEDDQLIICFSSLCVHRNTHGLVYTQKESDMGSCSSRPRITGDTAWIDVNFPATSPVPAA